MKDEPPYLPDDVKLAHLVKAQKNDKGWHDDRGLLTEPMDRHKLSCRRVLASVTHTFSGGYPIFHALMLRSTRSVRSIRITVTRTVKDVEPEDQDEEPGNKLLAPQQSVNRSS
ncbi:hypothetical protein DUI87_27482 [Hirundo rustica rustica]|uniref:Uncharacterized protein n=1 Tax=Hirundo rustica rustica TaxID=333673 RepID=A0A3M0J5G3_HIRRU|nr:hypothetical protein DUI87_27482 [Hirundo rustica rustica]